MRNRRELDMLTATGLGILLGAAVLAAFVHIPLAARLVATLGALGVVAFVANRLPFRELLALIASSIGALALAWMVWGGELALPMLGAFTILASIHLLVGQKQWRGSEERLKLSRRNLRLARVLERRNRMLAEANQAKARLLAAASHDLRQPAQALTMLVDLIEHADAPAAACQLDDARACTDTLSDKLQQLLDFNRLELGQYEPARQPVSIDPILAEVRDACAPLARQKGVDVRETGCGVAVESDAYLLRRLVFNLAENAVKFTQTGCVSLECKVDEEGVALNVRDTGAGIEAAQLDCILSGHGGIVSTFEGSQWDEGLGLGLSIVRRGAALLGHGLSVHSQPGRGTAVSLRLGPGVACGADGGAPGSDMARRRLEGCTVAVFASDEVAFDAWHDTLAGWGCHVTEGEAATAADVVLTDLGSSAEGLQAVQRLRLLAKNTAIPALVLTDELDAHAQARCAARSVLLAYLPQRPPQVQALLSKALVLDPTT